MTAQLPSRERLSDDLLGQIAFYAGEAICHPDPNYALEYQKLAYPANVLALVNEVIASRALLAAHEQEPVSFDALRDAVAEMTGGRPTEWSESTYKGHQVVPFINFNSLARIVEKFRTHPAPVPAVPDECPKCNDTGMMDSGGVQPWGGTYSGCMRLPL